MHNERRALIMALLAVLCWSTVATAFKLALEVLTPSWLLAFAVCTSWLFLSGLLLWRRQMAHAMRDFRLQWRSYLRQALINPVCYYLILFEAYDLLPAQQAQAINYTWAITMSLLAVPLLGQRLFPRDLLALLLAYLGVLVIATKGNLLGLEFDSISGVALALFSTLLWALYWILNTRAARQGEQSDATTSLWGSFMLAVPMLLVIALLRDGVPPLGWQAIGTGLYVGLFEMGITFVMWQTAMNLTRRTAAISSLIFLSPFLSLIFISQILGEAVHSATLIGLVLIMAGLAVQKLGGKAQAATTGHSE